MFYWWPLALNMENILKLMLLEVHVLRIFLQTYAWLGSWLLVLYLDGHPLLLLSFMCGPQSSSPSWLRDAQRLLTCSGLFFMTSVMSSVAPMSHREQWHPVLFIQFASSARNVSWVLMWTLIHKFGGSLYPSPLFSLFCFVLRQVLINYVALGGLEHPV